MKNLTCTVYSIRAKENLVIKALAHFCLQSLKDLKQEFLQKKERYEKLPSFSEIKVVLENLKKAMAWCLVRVHHCFFQNRAKHVFIINSKECVGSMTRKKKLN